MYFLKVQPVRQDVRAHDIHISGNTTLESLYGDQVDYVNMTQPMSLLYANALEIPDVISETYSDISIAGEGTYGIVYKATDAENRQVAIKFMKRGASAQDLMDRCTKIRYLHEQVKAVVTDDPGLVHVMNCVEASDKYVVYEWAGEEGVKMLPQLSFEDARALLKQVIIALHSLFRSTHRTILHHDLKWANVAVADGCLRLIDLDDWVYGQWGQRLVRTPHTPLFSPPEVLIQSPKKKTFSVVSHQPWLTLKVVIWLCVQVRTPLTSTAQE